MEQLLFEIDQLIDILDKRVKQKTISDRLFLFNLRGFCKLWEIRKSDIFIPKEIKEKENEIGVIIKALWNISGKKRQKIKDIKKKLRIVRKFLYEEVIPNIDQTAFSGGWGFKLFKEKNDYSAYKFLKSVFKKAKKNIHVIDGYVTEETLDYLGVSKKVSLKILTYNMYGKFKKDFKRFKKEYNIEVRLNQRVHDRFIIVDDSAFICGASLARAGSKATAIISLPANESRQIINLFNKQWKQSKKLK